MFFFFEENSAPALQKVKSNGKQRGRGLERQQERKRREEEKAINGRYDAQRPSGAIFLSVSSSPTSLLYPIQPLPSLPQFHFTSPPLHFHPLPWLEFGAPRHSPRPRICRLIDCPGAMGRNDAPVLYLKPCFFQAAVSCRFDCPISPQYFKLSWWFG